MKRRPVENPAGRAGRIWGDVDGLNHDLRGDRQRFMEQRPALSEADWPAFRDAYNAAMSSASRAARVA